MSIGVRSLLARVKQYRPDILEEQCMFALREAAKRVARFSNAIRSDLTPQILSKGQLSLTPTVSGSSVLRVESMRVSPTAGTFPAGFTLTAWNAATNTPTLTTPPAIGTGYVVTVGGTTSIGGNALWNRGDILYVDASGAWAYKTAVQNYANCYEYNKPTLEAVSAAPQRQSGQPLAFTQDNGVIEFYPVPDGVYSMLIQVSIVPTTETDTFTIEDYAVDPIVAGALEAIYLLPGEQQDKRLSTMYRAEFHRGMSNIKAIGIFGDGGSPAYQTGPFAGRQTFNLAQWYK